MNPEHVIETYKQAAAHWTGCDWSVRFEGDGPNLEGVSSTQALSVSHATAGEESERWLRAAHWLADVEAAARHAESEAKIAYGLAVGGYPGSALPHATRAYEIEARFHRRIIWLPFLHAIEDLVDEAGFVCETCGNGSGQESVVLPWTMPEQISTARHSEARR